MLYTSVQQIALITTLFIVALPCFEASHITVVFYIVKGWWLPNVTTQEVGHIQPEITTCPVNVQHYLQINTGINMYLGGPRKSAFTPPPVANRFSFF